ncbi:MAG: alpha/beta fold hydrolase [Deltaproteobacteria bacterium]|nr:alpha/beta fold hydrolase [Deltaproteobacteria bacterium]
MRQNIEFSSKGLLCRGWLYVPDSLAETETAPGIVMTHGFAGVKEMGLAGFAERFASAGFVTLVFDYRFWGESEGEPRNQIFALEMVEDYRNGITWLSDRPEVDPQRIGVWGTSYSGGLGLYVGTHDKRVKAVVAQVPSALNPESRRAKDPETWDRVGEMLIQDRFQRYKTGSVNYIKVVAPEGEPCVFPDKDAYEWYMKFRKFAPNWQNKVTLESLEKLREFDPVSLIHLMAPTALLLIPGENDNLIPSNATWQQTGSKSIFNC